MNKITHEPSELSSSHEGSLDYLLPFGGRLLALERNILKYRALEMILAIFYCEHLKRKMQRVVDSNAGFRKTTNIGGKKAGHRTNGAMTGKRVMRLLQEWQLINEGEAKAIRELVDFRNVIAHEVQSAVSDVGGSRFVRELNRLDSSRPKYSHGAVERLKGLIALLDDRTHNTDLTLTIDFEPLEFEAAERIYELELRRLRNTIDRQYEQRKQTIRKLNDELVLSEAEWGFDYHPSDPENKFANGRLTERGIKVCYRLYDLGKSPMAVALLMQISLHAAKRRRTQWESHKD